MARVTVEINGQRYPLGCDDGEEKRIADLAKFFARRVNEVRQAVGQSSEARLMLVAALIICDELADATARLERLSRTGARVGGTGPGGTGAGGTGAGGTGAEDARAARAQTDAAAIAEAEARGEKRAEERFAEAFDQTAEAEARLSATLRTAAQRIEAIAAKLAAA